MNKTAVIAILGTAVIFGLVLLVGNFKIDVNIGGKGTANSQTQETQDPMADHHGGGTAVDTALFNSLVGKAAPDFTIESYDGKKYILSELKGKNVILFFNEGLMCYPSCWNQIVAFGKDKDLSSKAVVLNITVDTKASWKQAIDKMPELASATVVFDNTRQVSGKYGVLSLPSSMHKGTYPGHTYVVIDKEGIVRFVSDDPAMAIRNQELSAELAKL